MTTIRFIKSIGGKGILLTKARANASPLHIRFIPASPRSNPRLVRKTFLQTILVVAISLLAPIVAHADSATWNLNPTSGDWNTAANWTPMAVPNGPSDTATFALSNVTNISVSADTEVNTVTLLQFGLHDPCSSTFAAHYQWPGSVGVGELVTFGDFSNSGTILLSNSSTAGNCDFRINMGGAAIFTGTSSAGSAYLYQEGGGSAMFMDHSTANNAYFYSNGGSLQFSGHSTADIATIDQIGGGGFTASEISRQHKML